MSIREVSNRCEGSKSDVREGGIGGRASEGVAIDEDDFFDFFDDEVVAGARSVQGAVVEEEAAVVKEGISNARSAIVFSSSSRNLGCSSPRGASSD